MTLERSDQEPSGENSEMRFFIANELFNNWDEAANANPISHEKAIFGELKVLGQRARDIADPDFSVVGYWKVGHHLLRCNDQACLIMQEAWIDKIRLDGYPKEEVLDDLVTRVREAYAYDRVEDGIVGSFEAGKNLFDRWLNLPK